MPASSVSPVTDLRRDLALYTVARLGLIVVGTVVLLLFKLPLLVALAIAIVVGFPLGILAFRPLNRKVTAGLAERGAERAAQRERLRAELRGDEPDPS